MKSVYKKDRVEGKKKEEMRQYRICRENKSV